MGDRFVFDGEILAEMYQDLEGDWGIFYNNNTHLLLGAVKLLADWEIEMYEKYKSE